MSVDFTHVKIKWNGLFRPKLWPTELGQSLCDEVKGESDLD